MKKSIIFGVLAMFAVSALSIQNVNAQNETVVKKTQPKKETVKNDQKEQPKNSAQAVNEPKAKVQPNEDVKTTKGSTSGAKVKNEPNVQKTTLEPQAKDVMKPQNKRDVKVEKSDKNEPVMRDVQKPQNKNVGKASKEQKKETTNKKATRKGSEPVKNENQVGTTNVNKNNQSGTIKTKKAEPKPNNVVGPKNKNENKVNKNKTNNANAD